MTCLPRFAIAALTALCLGAADHAAAQTPGTAALAGSDNGGFLFVTFHGESGPLTEQIYLSSGNFVRTEDIKFPFRFRHGEGWPISRAEMDRPRTAFAP